MMSRQVPDHDDAWPALTLEAFPTWDASAPATSRGHREARHVYGGRSTTPHTTITMWTAGNATQGVVQLQIGASRDGRTRAWVVRVHLMPGIRIRQTLCVHSTHSTLPFLLFLPCVFFASRVCLFYTMVDTFYEIFV